MKFSFAFYFLAILSQELYSVSAARRGLKKGKKGKKDHKSERQFKNIIMMVPDGCDEGVLGLARWYKAENLQVDSMRSGSVHPYMANSLMTDSAPGGTAYSSGELTTDKFIAVGPRRNDTLSTLDESTLFPAYAPIPTNLEAAKAKGMTTGLLSTSRVTHATPGAFAGHVDSRSKEKEISKQMVFNGVDVVMGGGRRNMLPLETCYAEGGVPEVTGARDDCLNLEEELEMRGYDLCYNKDDLMALDGEKAWCSFASSHMSPDIDRKHFTPDQPSLSEMTSKAIELLDKNDDGFFLMVEGSQVDWAGHANDPIWMVTDFIAWDDAVKAAVEFAEMDGETLVLALPDHNTGGLKVGNYKFDYLDRTVEFARDPLLKMTMTSGGVIKSMGVAPQNATEADLKESVSKNWGIDLLDEEAQQILEYSSKYSEKFASFPGAVIPMNYGLARLVSEEYTIAGWESHGHNGEDVPMWAYGMDPPTGVITNTDVGKLVTEAMGGMGSVKTDLYVDLDTTGLNYSVSLDDVTNEMATIEGFDFPLNTDYFLDESGERVYVPGITVYAPMTEKLYISSKAIEMVKDMKV